MLYIDIFVCYFVALFDDNTVFIDLDQSLKPIRAEWLKKNAKNIKKTTGRTEPENTNE